MVKLSELLDPWPSELWTLVKQCGVDDVVTLLEGAEQHQRWLRATGATNVESLRGVERPWSREAIGAVVDRYAEHGLRVAAIEDTAPMDAIRLGLPGRDEELADVHEQIRAMGELGIPVLCYNWMVLGSWARTDSEIVTRGGALTTGFRLADAEALPPMAEPGSITHEQLWESLCWFLERTLPVAEEAGVQLALHPDDPPIAVVRGVPHLMSSVDAYRRLVEEFPSPSNRITFCQGNWRLMTDDLPATIAEFLPHIAFVHFRDVEGPADDFYETFHDLGPTDLAACMELYLEAGFDGPMRPDHVPTLVGESNDKPGYAALGRLHALGYIRGLMHALPAGRKGGR